ncbi:MAG TPA: retropepsin-like aspartic protease [Candidatus Eremiobacteraceae bacterium]|nr:retropepsin-like aspartic protease [Candidatus Eremiobacteraceae bacterium]
MARTTCVVVLVSALALVLGTAASAREASTTPSPAPAVSPTATPASTSGADAAIAAASSSTPDPSDQPPSGITPTKVSLAQVLRAYRSSEGKPAKPVSTMREVDAISAYGESGTESYARSGDDYVETTQLGPSTTSSGSNHGKRWEQNENGYTNALTDMHPEEELSSGALSKAEHGENVDTVRLLGTVTTPVTAYVVEVDPKGGRHEWLFFDTTSGRLVRREASRTGHRLIWTYDDFRTTDGTTESWHEHFSDGFVGNDVDTTTTSLQLGAAVSPADVAIPQSRSPLHFPAGVTEVRLPARIEYGVIIVRLTINGRGLDFQLDSGASNIVIDADVARQLGLQTFGQRTQAVAGDFQASDAIVPQIQIGQLTMSNVSVHCLPFASNWDEHTKIVGLLGYDFLAGAVVKVDYLNQTVDAYDYSAFHVPPGQTFQVPIRLDDDVPVASAQVGGGAMGQFIVDTGSFAVLVFPSFVSENSNNLLDFGYSEGSRTFYPIVTSQGVGGEVSLMPLQASTFRFATVGFNDFTVLDAVRAQSDFKDEDLDGLIGHTLLKYFDVYFDYRDSMLILQPNKLLVLRVLSSQ